jgi:hypothetical protein
MLTSPLYISQVKKVRADGRPFFTHADRPGFGAAAMGGVWCRQGDWIIIAASLAETSLTGFVLYYKLRERDRSRGQVAPDRA